MRPNRIVLMDQRESNAQLHGEQINFAQIDHLAEKIIPAPQEGEDRCCNQCWNEQRHYDSEKDL